ncbi:SAM-dependent methyltransferase [Amycolatopsis ultiminotia]|uniref:S-adenosyl-L-methionine-dependent methyltransferase n=2 Tax=Amycolatopsis ultiminotia TaxID=543629 RepID=A0ABP6WBZ9_9PSEU
MAADRRGPLGGVGKTALGVAAVRARESRRPDRLFDDPYAQAFLDAAPGVLPDEPVSARELAEWGPMAALGTVFHAHGVLRTRFFDDYLLAATAAGCHQVVLLAAGLDTRVFRLSWPDGVRVFEVDLPEVLEFKQLVLAEQAAGPRCERVIVPADLRGRWCSTLVAAGFREPVPTAWLAEGLLVYLSAEQAARLLTAVSELSAPGSRLAFEQGGMAAESLPARARAMPAMAEYAALWRGGLGVDAPSWLAEHDWCVHTHDRAALADSYGRSDPKAAGGGFLTAIRT